MSQINDIRMTIILKNNILISKREELKMSQIDFASFCGVTLKVYTEFESLKVHPNDSDKDYENAEKICNMLCMDMKDVFPESLTKVKVSKKVIFVPSEKFNKLSYQPKQTLQIESIQLNQRVEKALSSLTDRESFVIRNRFGIGDDDDKTLKDIGGMINRGSERVRSIESKALRKMRHPSISEELKLATDRGYEVEESRREREKEAEAATKRAIQDENFDSFLNAYDATSIHREKIYMSEIGKRWGANGNK